MLKPKSSKIPKPTHYQNAAIDYYMGLTNSSYVISIENSRSNNQTLREITEGGYSHQVGNGVYDIHSPVVPTTEQILQQLRTGVANLPVKQIWVNPDCGLKTRRWSEVIPALKNMVEATKVLREEIITSNKSN